MPPDVANLKPKTLKKQKVVIKAPEKIGFRPDNYEEVLGENVEMTASFWNLLKNKLTFRRSTGKEGSFYDPFKDEVVVDMKRYTTKIGKKKIIAHEFGHAIHNQQNWIKQTLGGHNSTIEIDEVFFKWKKNFGFKQRGATKEKSVAALRSKISGNERQRLKEKYKLNDKDHDEHWGALMDTVGSLTNGEFGWGHTKAYYKVKRGYGAKVEFFAHASENTFAGNPYIKEQFPELFEDSKKMIKSLIETIE